MDFKISKKEVNQYLVKPIIIGLLLDLTITVLGSIFYKVDFIFVIKLFLGALLGQIFVFYLPIITFYSNYKRINKNLTLTVIPETKEFIYYDGINKIHFSEEEITELRVFVSIPTYHNRTIFLVWYDFFYSKIITSKGEFVITCLICTTLEDYISEDKIKKKGSLFAQGFPPKSVISLDGADMPSVG